MNRLQVAMDERLYTGGCQIEELKVCCNCGDDVYEDGKEIDGDYYCGTCFSRRVNYIYKVAEKVFARYLVNRLDEAALRQALEDYRDDYTNE